MPKGVYERIPRVNCGEGINIGNLGKRGRHWKLSEKTKEKMRGNKNGLGFKHTNKAKKKIRQSLEGNKYALRKH